MAVKQDQPLQLISSKYYGWYSENAFIGPAWSFQYSENTNVRDDISGVQLSSLPETRDANDFPANQTAITAYCVATVNSTPSLVTFYQWGASNAFTTRDNSDRPNETIQWSTGTTEIRAAVRFWELVAWVREQRIFAFAYNEIRIIETATWTASIVDPTGNIDNTTELWSAAWSTRITPLVYSNSIIIVWHGNVLRRYVPVASPELPVWRSILRKYKEGDEIIGVNISGNYVKVTISDADINTRTYYLSGTFDVEDWGIVETIDWDNMLWSNVTTFDNQDYYMMRSGFDASALYVYRLNWYTKEKVFRTLWANWQSNQLEYFTSWVLYEDPFQVKRGIMYVPTADGIWTFGMSKLWQFIVNKDWTLWGNRSARKRQILGDYLYVFFQAWGADIETRYFLEYRNNWYTTDDGILIDRILTGPVVGQWKENIQMNIWYELDVNSGDPGTIEVYIRPNRVDKTVAWWWFLVSTITDQQSMVNEIYLDTSNFRADWNCIEYKLVLQRGADFQTSPFVYDVSLFYNPNIERGEWITYNP